MGKPNLIIEVTIAGLTIADKDLKRIQEETESFKERVLRDLCSNSEGVINDPDLCMFSYSDGCTFVPANEWTPYLKEEGLPENIIGARLDIRAERSRTCYEGEYWDSPFEFQTTVKSCQINRLGNIILDLQGVQHNDILINRLRIFRPKYVPECYYRRMVEHRHPALRLPPLKETWSVLSISEV